MTCSEILALSGGIFEVAGIALVALDILSDRQRAVAVAPRGRAYTDEAIVRAQAVISAVEEGPPAHRVPVEERLAAVEERVRVMPDDFRRGLIALDDSLREHVARTTARVEDDVHRRDDALRAVLREKLSGRLWLRWLGVVLLVVGVVFTTAANLV